MSRRSFWVGSSGPRSLVPFRRVSGLALSCGCVSWSVRGSSRSFSGSVVWAEFASPGAAARFGFRASHLVGVPVSVRPGVCSVGGLVWVASVPVAR
ncbi:hypothetical protein [Picosynechococcus sp. NKBG15041c]|uniref:hypothetical protein n=1 Tax=Picosynechococcus sp. NKBG15041c TaxID=1407650 RepID=UPI0011DC77E3|nr:hypothetical protein [Picosynechococcus sp. NKBG15041c]